MNLENQDNKITVIKAVSDDELKQAFAIRKEVFVIGQNVPLELEVSNNETAVHFLALIDNIPAGAARYRRTENGYKLERFAVLQQYRNQKIGEALVKTVLKELPAEAMIYLHAQIDAANLYFRNGFVQVGDEFEEANIKHIKMVYKG
jgi:predicted GNAT family N-acyltransferase